MAPAESRTVSCASPNAAPYVLLIGTHPQGRGGVASVIAGYLRHAPAPGLQSLVTHVQGGFAAKLGVLMAALPRAVAHGCNRRCLAFHLHTASRASFYRKSLFWLLGKLTGKALIVHIHGGGFADFMRNSHPLLRGFIRFVLTRSERVIVLTPQWQQTISALAPGAKVDVLYNPVDLPAEEPASRRPCQLLFLGKVDRSKGLWDLYRAVAQLRHRYPDIRLICGGDGNLRQAAALADSLAITEHIQHRGWIGGEEKSQLLRESTALVLPSYSEGLPVAIIEALAHRLPVIATAVGGIPDVIRHADTGLLVAPGDITGLAAAIASCIDNHEQMRRCAERGRALVETTMAAATVFRAVSQLYFDIQSSRAPGATNKVDIR